jgi:hypothetical protein
VVSVTEALNFSDINSEVTMTEKEDSLEQLTHVLLAGKSDETKQRAYAAMAKGNNEREILDAVVEVVNIISDLQEVNQYDQAKMASLESAVNACLQVLEQWLAKTEGRFGLKVIVGPVGLKTGVLPSLALSASLRAIGFRSTSLGKTQTALDLLRNSEELDADLVIPMLPSDEAEHLLAFAEAYERGGFKIISIAPGKAENVRADITIARNSEEAISRATQWALKKAR